MVIIQATVDERVGNEKFSFSSITRRFNFSKPTVDVVLKEPTKIKRKFSFRRLFSRKNKEQDYEFKSGFGEFIL